jgi:transcriptional regulator with XRE-family HTH domain
MRFAEYRKDLKLSQEECARQLGLKSKSRICEIEKVNRASPAMALKIERWSGGKVSAASLNLTLRAFEKERAAA